MAIYHRGHKVKEVWHQGRKVKEIWHMGKKMYTSAKRRVTLRAVKSFLAYTFDAAPYSGDGTLVGSTTITGASFTVPVTCDKVLYGKDARSRPAGTIINPGDEVHTDRDGYYTFTEV